MDAIRVNKNTKVSRVSSKAHNVCSDSNLAGFFIEGRTMKTKAEKKAYAAQWRRNNPEKMKLACKKWRSDSRNNTYICLRSRVYQSLGGKLKNFKLWDLLGYDLVQFMGHIEKQFQIGMTWENHGEEWEIDHIIPISFFLFDSPVEVEFKMCWRLENIQPMWKHEHKVKSNKILVA